MAEPFLSELMPINQNLALFALLGTTSGGDDRSAQTGYGRARASALSGAIGYLRS